MTLRYIHIICIHAQSHNSTHTHIHICVDIPVSKIVTHLVCQFENVTGHTYVCMYVNRVIYRMKTQQHMNKKYKQISHIQSTHTYVYAVVFSYYI